MKEYNKQNLYYRVCKPMSPVKTSAAKLVMLLFAKILKRTWSFNEHSNSDFEMYMYINIKNIEEIMLWLIILKGRKKKTKQRSRSLSTSFWPCETGHAWKIHAMIRKNTHKDIPSHYLVFFLCDHETR